MFWGTLVSPAASDTVDSNDISILIRPASRVINMPTNGVLMRIPSEKTQTFRHPLRFKVHEGTLFSRYERFYPALRRNDDGTFEHSKNENGIVLIHSAETADSLSQIDKKIGEYISEIRSLLEIGTSNRRYSTNPVTDDYRVQSTGSTVETLNRDAGLYIQQKLRMFETNDKISDETIEQLKIGVALIFPIDQPTISEIVDRNIVERRRRLAGLSFTDVLTVTNPFFPWQKIRLNDPVLLRGGKVSMRYDHAYQYQNTLCRRFIEYWDFVKSTGSLDPDDIHFLSEAKLGGQSVTVQSQLELLLSTANASCDRNKTEWTKVKNFGIMAKIAAILTLTNASNNLSTLVEASQKTGILQTKLLEMAIAQAAARTNAKDVAGHYKAFILRTRLAQELDDYNKLVDSGYTPPHHPRSRYYTDSEAGAAARAVLPIIKEAALDLPFQIDPSFLTREQLSKIVFSFD